MLVPIGGALIIGFMAARYGDRKRSAGMGFRRRSKRILINGSRVEPKVAHVEADFVGDFDRVGRTVRGGRSDHHDGRRVWVNDRAAVSSDERGTEDAAGCGAAAGMSATFAALRVASVLLAVELLLFEWKPRSLIPVAIASATAAVCRRYLLGFGPLFPVPEHPLFIGVKGILGCVLVGLLAGLLSALLTQSIYAAEDAFHKLPIHWMWWPAIGGLAIGLGGLVFPQALGVGYDTIGSLLQGSVTTHVILGVLLVKWFIWAVSLGSGTSPEACWRRC